MTELTTGFLLVMVGAAFSISYITNRVFYLSNGGVIFSPLSIIFVSFFLIFLLRPVVILAFDAPTLDYELIDRENAFYAINLGLLSLLAILLPFCKAIKFLNKRKVFKNASFDEINIGRLFFIGIILSCLILVGIIIYGSAFNNTIVRAENPDGFKAYFIFIVFQKFHYVSSALMFYYMLTVKSRRWHLTIILFLVAAIVLTLISSGRAPTFFLAITLMIIYIFNSSKIISWKNILNIIFMGLIILFFNYSLGGVRFMMKSSDWEWFELVNLFIISHDDDLILTLIMFSWDYSVFDVLVRIVNNLNEFTWGATNLQYILSFVPRVIWPEKPLDQGYMLYLTQTFYPHVFSANGSNFSGSIAGEGFINFGFFGVFLYSFCFSMFYLKLYKKACIRKSKNDIIIYALFFPFAFAVTRNGLDAIISCILFVYIPFVLINWIIVNKKILPDDLCT